MHTKITIEVDGRPYEIHHDFVTGREIKEIGHRDEGAVYSLAGDHRRQIPDHEAVHVHDGERFVIEHGARE
jgi:hypothetical protein